MTEEEQFGAWLTEQAWLNVIKICKVIAGVVPVAALAADLPAWQQGLWVSQPAYFWLFVWHVVTEIWVLGFLVANQRPLAPATKTLLSDLFAASVIVLSTWIGITTWHTLGDFSIYALGTTFTAAMLYTVHNARRPLYIASAALLLAVVYSSTPDLATFLNRAINPICIAIVCFMVDRYTMEQCRELFAEKKRVEFERARADRVLYNVLPESIANELKTHNKVHAAKFENMSVAFADIVGFTRFSSKLPPDALILVLDQIFSTFDALVERYGLEKIKTIGDAYMVVANNQTAKLARLSLEMIEALDGYDKANGTDLSLRIGMHTGPAVGGVIGVKRFVYDIWGDTVNIASRMESSGTPGRVHITESVRQQLGDAFNVEPRGVIDVKGKGEMSTYFLVAERTPALA